MPMLIPVAIAAAAAYTVGATIAATVVLTAMSMYQQQKAKRKARDEYNKSLTDRLVMVATTNAARSIVLGRVRTGDGVVFKGTWGSKSENMTLVIALAGHEIDAIEQIYFGDIPVTLDGSGLVVTPPYGVTRRETATHQVASTGGAQTVVLPNVPTSILAVTYQDMGDAPGLAYSWTPGSASISFNTTGITGTVYISYTGNNQYSAARVTQFLGGDAQDLSAALASRFPSLITSAHKFRGFAGLIVDMIYTQDAYPSGVPAITARVRGDKVYDPRTGLTAWSENPALCTRHIALHPWAGAAFEDEIDDAAVIAAANACDVTHTYTDSAGTSTTRPIYTCAYVASTEASPDTHMNELVEAMSGKWGLAGGRIRVCAGVYTAPVATITDEWLGPGQRQINPGPGMADLVNIITPTIADAAQNHVSTPIAPVPAAAYVTADGMELPTDTTMSAVDFAPQAQHICAVSLREMRQGMTLNWPVNMRGFVLELFDNVYLNSSRYGFSLKPFQVLGWSFNLQGGIQLQLRETGASIYQPDDEFPANDPEQNTALPLPWVVPTIENLQAFSGTNELLLQDDGTVVTRVRLTFDAIEDEAVLSGGQIEVQYRAPDGEWETQYFDGAMTSVVIQGLQDGQTYLIRAKARNELCGGDWRESIVHKVVGKTAPPSDVTGFTGTPQPGGIMFSWVQNPDADRRDTVFRLGASWSTATPLREVDGTSWFWPFPADGAYTILARHRDTSGGLSNLVASVTVTVAGDNTTVGTGQLTDQSATEVIITAIPTVTTTITTGGPGSVYSVQHAATAYVNTWTEPVTVEITAGTARAFQCVGGATALTSYMEIDTRDPGGAITPHGEYYPQAPVPPVAAGTTATWFDSRVSSVVLQPGHTLNVAMKMVLTPVVISSDIRGSKVISTDMTLRFAVIKR